MHLFSVNPELFHILTRWLPKRNFNQCECESVTGLSGESWHIWGPDIDILAREQSVAKTELVVNRYCEAKILRRNLSQLMTPKVVLCHPRWLVVQWLPGQTLSVDALRQLAINGRLAEYLAQIHSQPLCGYALHLKYRLMRYWTLIDKKRMTPHWARQQQFFIRQKEPTPLKQAVIHMDVHAGNMVKGTQGNIALIDWEYAADGDIALEFATLFASNAWDNQTQDALLSHYCSVAYTDLAMLKQRIAQWSPWVEYLTLMWLEVRWQQSHNPYFLELAQPLQQRMWG